MEPRLHKNFTWTYQALIIRSWKNGWISCYLKEIETFKKHDFGHSSSLIKVEINRGLWRGLFQNGMLRPTIEEYSKILRVPYKMNQVLNYECLKLVESSWILYRKAGETNDYLLSTSRNLFAKQNAYETNQAVFCSSHQEWSHNWIIAFELAILGHVLFPKKLSKNRYWIIGTQRTN